MKKKILICDDDQGILEMLEIVFNEDKYEVLTEGNSLRVFECIKNFRPDLLILDLWMPVLSGDQITQKIKSQPDDAHMPVLIMSASRDGGEIAKNAGANAYIAKPFNVNEFVDLVDKLNSEAIA
ncbi:response regulator [Mucilaginibacter sp. 14171R-50]|uniref:response regulator n=1 Tax=Mucilaginibacter sp. 14171R-50 TaxID=2703789 RepID=UPI00138DA564|nr:response regulator [Mucilaginibacter sp. 14171R-50]QHS55276.1 response regulator [Mucilaginibacter sp. 14171R-50]